MGPAAAGSGELLPLNEEAPATRRRRGWSGVLGAFILAAAAGGIAGLLGGKLAGLITALVVALPLCYVVAFTARRRLWLQGSTVLVRTWRTRRIDLVEAERIDLLVTDVRGVRSVSLLVNARKRGRTVKIDLAGYAGTGGRELGILALRKLANAVMNNVRANGIVFGELLVAQLRAEARGDSADERPLHRLASAAPQGKFAQRFTMEAVSRFVATLD